MNENSNMAAKVSQAAAQVSVDAAKVSAKEAAEAVKQEAKEQVENLKHLLTSAALGMMPSKKWKGRYDANGGYLVVKKDGEILCYHFYDKNRFEDFLFANAYLERGKTHRHGYASLYRREFVSLTA